MNWTITQIASVVLCAMGSGLAFSSFGHTPILGYIMAGILLGPSGFQFITNREAVGVFSEMGILFLLFIIGLSLSFEKIRNIWKTSIVATLFSTAFIYAVMLVAGYFLNIPNNRIILITFCVALSSTAVTVKSLASLKEHDDSVEENTFGILIAQDLLALVMVLVINVLGTKEVCEYKTHRLLAVLLFTSGLIFYFAKYHQHIHKLTTFIKKHDNMLSITVFGFCLGSAVFAEIAGISAPFGAFIAGLILGNSNLHEEVKNIASPIEEILLMTFFLSVGLLVDLEFVWHNIFTILSLLLFITCGKTIINIFVLRLCRFPLKDSFVISVLLGHIGEFSFMLAYAASKVGLIDEQGVKFLISLTALSLFLSPFWLIFAERCRSLTRRVDISSLEFFSLATRRELYHLSRALTFLKTVSGDSLNIISEKIQNVAEKIKERLK